MYALPKDDRVPIGFFPDLFVALFVAFCHVSAIGELFAPFLQGTCFTSPRRTRKSEHVSFSKGMPSRQK